MNGGNFKERYKSNVAVFLVLTRINKEGNKEILLQKRKNTGYMDGMYDLSATGHLEENESIKDAMIREAKEELGIEIRKEDLELCNIYHENKSELGNCYLRIFFTAKNYIGIPRIAEIDKCEEISWFDIDKLPDNTIYHIKNAINLINNGINYYDEKFNS